MPFDRFLVLEEMAHQRITLGDLAGKTGITTRGLSMMLGPTGNPTSKAITAIAAALNASEGAFFSQATAAEVAS